MYYDREVSFTAGLSRRHCCFAIPLCESGCKFTNLFLIVQYADEIKMLR